MMFSGWVAPRFSETEQQENRQQFQAGRPDGVGDSCWTSRGVRGGTLFGRNIKLEAYATMITDDDFAIGAEVMIHSLREHWRIRRPVVVVVTAAVSEGTRNTLKAIADEIVEVEPVAMPLPEGEDAEPGCEVEYLGYTSVRVWGLTQYKRVVYIDADTVIMESIDELFDRKVDFAAAPDVYPPDKFNPGVMVLKPCLAVMEDMLSKVSKLSSYDGRDTGFLNAYFSDWYTGPAEARLPFTYNALRTVFGATHEKTPGYWKAIGPVKIIHFCGFIKPWEEAKSKGGKLELIWWQRYAQMKINADSPTE